jgi:hypothetical protein
MNDLCTEIGSGSICHAGEELCGDHVDVFDRDKDSLVVLADGLGSGVKASILSTLTSKIISTMMSEGLSLEDCVSTIAATLPICSVRGVAYSTFTIIRIENDETAELIQYDNPDIILIRDGENCEYPVSERIIEGKKILCSRVRLRENDVFLAMSDGCPHAGVGVSFNFGWKRENIIDFIRPYCTVGYTAKTIAAILLDEANRLYGGTPGDDATVCAVRVRRREPMNLLFGPPSDPDDCDKMMSLFFSKEGKHIVCGGTTSALASKWLGKPLIASLDFVDPSVPPIAKIEGVDLVTEGVITVNKVLSYAKNDLADNRAYPDWSTGRDGASKICRMLFEEATDINFYVGRAMNPAHQNPDLPINFSIKMQLVSELSECLKKMGKRIKVSYF